MREIDAVCAALSEHLPRQHPELFKSIRDVRYLSFSAYAVGDITRKYIVKVRAMPPQAEDPDGFRDWLSWCSKDDKEIWIHQHVHKDVPVAERFEGGFGQLDVAQIDGVNGSQRFGYQIQSRLPYDIAAIVRARTFQWNRETGVMAVGPGFAEITADTGLLTKIGRMARLIHQTPTKGYGGGWYSRREDFDAATESFDFATWEAMVDQLVANCDRDLLIHHGILTERDWERLGQRTAQLRRLEFEPHLFHGDLVCNLQNLLVDADTGDIKGVVDWESSGSGPAMHYELALSLRTWHRDGWPEQQIQQNFAAFMRGYAVSLEQYRQQYQYDVETLLLLLVCDLFCLALKGEFTLLRGGRESFKTLIRRILPSES
jgi:hypothetical protein